MWLDVDKGKHIRVGSPSVTEAAEVPQGELELSGRVFRHFWINLRPRKFISRLVIGFLPRSKHLLISCLQSPSAVIWEPRKISHCVHCFPNYLP